MRDPSETVAAAGGGTMPRHIVVLWPDDDAWYECEVLGFDEETGQHDLRYTDDGIEESIDLGKEQWRPVLAVASEH